MKNPFRILRPIGVLVVLLAAAGCTVPQTPSDLHDPYEQTNRTVHAGNKALDRMVARPASKAYAAVVPKQVRQSVGNFATNLDMPRLIVNSALQGRGENTVHNLSRFLINTTLGLGGLFDPAESFGLDRRDTDFGETLHVWGAGEGAYVELPVFGPSTSRDAGGMAVDFVMNPVRFLATTPEQDKIALGTQVGRRLGQRSDLGSLLDNILYESEDSYAQARIIYLQRRRAELGTAMDDPYSVGDDDPYAADPYDADPYAADPYEDPYGLETE